MTTATVTPQILTPSARSSSRAEMDAAVAVYGDVVGLTLVRREGSAWAEFDAGPIRFALHGGAGALSVGTAIARSSRRRSATRSSGTATQCVRRAVARSGSQGVSVRPRAVRANPA